MADILEGVDEILVFDALVSSYTRLERKMKALQAVIERSGSEFKPVAMHKRSATRSNKTA